MVMKLDEGAKIYVLKSMTVHMLCIYYYNQNASFGYLLWQKLVQIVHRQGHKREQKHRLKNFVKLHNHGCYQLDYRICVHHNG